MPRRVIDRFFERSAKRRAARRRSILSSRPPLKIQINIAHRKNFFGVAAHSSRQIQKRIVFGRDRPDNIVHRSHRFAGDVGNRSQKIAVAVLRFLFRNFTQKGNARQIRADVVVQIGGDARPHFFHFQQTSQTIFVKQIN